MPKNKIKTEWNLKLLYKSHDDPQIEKDMLTMERLCRNFEVKYKKTDFTKNENTLFKALQEYENLTEKVSGIHAPHYFYYSVHLNSEDKKAGAELNKISQRYTATTNKVLFFELRIGKIPQNKQKIFLISKKLAYFKYFLEKIFQRAKHNLSEPEERILSLKSLPGREMWIDGYQKLVSKQTVRWKKKEMPIAEAVSLVSILPAKERRILHDLTLEKLKETADFAEAEINAVYTDKKINDELRGFKNPYDATFLSYETEEPIVNSLVSEVTKEFKVSHRFYKLKAKLLKLKKLNYADRGAFVGKVNEKISFQKGLDIVRKAFGAMDLDFRNILDGYLVNGQIDVYPKKGKRGGAYSSGGVNSLTFTLLNHTDSMKSVKTLAHEIGHGINTEYSKKQKPLYQEYSTAVAEVASTFFEEVVFDDLIKTLSPKEQVIALHDKISDQISTVFRQIACFNFEKDLHQAIRSKGYFQKEEIGVLMNRHMKSYLGPITHLKDLDGYFFAYWSHIRSFFYVYSYAYGCLISKALYKKYREDPKYLSKIETFLSAGSSKSPYDIFKDIGIDTSDPNFWKLGVKEIEKDIGRLEKMARKAKMIK